MAPGFGLLIAYVAGSLPSAYLAGRARGVDLRTAGSGNLGATNVARVLGAKTGVAVFLADLLKGFLPVYFLPGMTETPRPDLWALGFGIAAIIGHVRPVFLMGKGGGKGVATATGVFLALAPAPMIITQAVWAAVFYATRYVSVASLAGAVMLPAAVLAFSQDPRSPVFLAALAVAAFVFWTHRANIARLRRGEEHRFVKKVEAS